MSDEPPEVDDEDPELENPGEEAPDMEPQFSRRAARVINSRYWSSSSRPNEDVLQGYEDKQFLVQALGRVANYDGLTGRAKELFDAAEAMMFKDWHDADLRERIGGGDAEDFSDFGMPVPSNDPLTDDEQKQVEELLLAARAAKRVDVIEWLENARRESPSAVRQLLAQKE